MAASRRAAGSAGFGQPVEPARGGKSGRRATPPEEKDPREVARDICLRQLAVRPRSRSELASALRSKGIDDDIAAEVLDRYDEVGLIDDQAFAKAWVTSRHHGRGLASRALAQELRRKGVDNEAVGTALDELAPATEEATARSLVQRRLRAEKTNQPEAAFRRLVGMLARKGYPPGLAIRVVREELAQRADSAEFADSLDPDALVDAIDPSTVDGLTPDG